MMMVEKGDYDTLVTKKAVTPELGLTEVAKKFGINENTIARLTEAGYPIDKAIDLVINGITEPGQISEAFVLTLGASKSYADMGKLLGLTDENIGDVKAIVNAGAVKLSEVKAMGDSGKITPLEGKALMSVYSMTRDILIAVAQERDEKEKAKMIETIDLDGLMKDTAKISYLQSKVVVSKAVNRNVVIAAAVESAGVNDLVKGSAKEAEELIDIKGLKADVAKKKSMTEAFMAQVFGNSVNISDAFPAGAIDRMKDGERGVILQALFSKAIAKAA